MVRRWLLAMVPVSGQALVRKHKTPAGRMREPGSLKNDRQNPTPKPRSHWRLDGRLQAAAHCQNAVKLLPNPAPASAGTLSMPLVCSSSSYCGGDTGADNLRRAGGLAREWQDEDRTHTPPAGPY